MTLDDWMIIEYRSHKIPLHSSLQAEVTLHHTSYHDALAFVVVSAVAMFVVPVLIVILGCCLKHTFHILSCAQAGLSRSLNIQSNVHRPSGMAHMSHTI